MSRDTTDDSALWFLGAVEPSQHDDGSQEDRGIDRAHLNKEGSKMAKDPVCAMEVNEQTAKWTSTYEGKPYSFCSAGCKESFDKDPDRYLRDRDLLGRKIKPQ